MVSDVYARLINRFPSAIAGPSPQTSWLLYSRVWTLSEEKVVDEAIDKIRLDVPNPVGVVPFTELKAIVNMSHNSTTTSHKDTTGFSASIAPAPMPSKREPSADDDLEIKDFSFQKFEFIDNDLAELEAQIEAATEQPAEEQSPFTHQTEKTESEQPRPTKKAKIVKPLTSWGKEPLIEEKETTLPPAPKVSKKLRPSKLTRPTTAATPLGDQRETILPPASKVPKKIRPTPAATTGG
ncbi:hypothetical protein PSTG_12055 [Puccinia striiformis f. sp. tritici PST-78]|uniref:Uncharacterized protein n=1 Tax=Puccinia striiformis f. sp. tritici PST-78 TaxID=1165861 RepID=A0A0L0V5Y5_9BASI|nr:hypothetical protein PSTG_12055 [Puccinia striiformis f. sp. tritici PST-78]